MVGANRIRPLMIQINFPIYGTMAFVIHSKGMFACYLNGDFWEMVNWIKKWWMSKTWDRFTQKRRDRLPTGIIRNPYLYCVWEDLSRLLDVITKSLSSISVFYNQAKRFEDERSWRFRRRKLYASTEFDTKHKASFKHWIANFLLVLLAVVLFICPLFREANFA